jgi:F-box/leucine-rich repeat protein 14
MSIPSLVDLCLFTVCKNLDGCDYINTLPDFLRHRLGNLFKQEPIFQQSIENLNFSKCKTLTDEELKNISFLKNLTKLNLSHCDKLTGYGMPHISQLTNLRTLYLNHCRKVSLGFYFLPSLKQITTLEVAFCEIQDPVLHFITHLPNLTQLNLMCNRLTDDGCTTLEEATKLVQLNLSMNPLITHKTLEGLVGLTNLTSLNLNFCKLLTSDGIAKLSKALPKLKQLDIIGCDRALTDGNICF